MGPDEFAQFDEQVACEGLVAAEALGLADEARSSRSTSPLSQGQAQATRGTPFAYGLQQHPAKASSWSTDRPGRHRRGPSRARRRRTDHVIHGCRRIQLLGLALPAWRQECF